MGRPSKRLRHREDRHHPPPPEPLANRAMYLASRGQAEEALAVMEQAVLLDPDNPALLLNQATILCTLERFDAARMVFTHALACDPAPLLRALLHTNRGRASLEAKQPGYATDALQDFQEALKALAQVGADEETGPVLSQAKHLALAGQQEAQERLVQRNQRVEANLGLVGYVMRHYQGLWLGRLDEQDAFQEGVIGLMRAAEKYDPAQGELSTYAVWWITRMVARAAAQHGRTLHVPVYLQHQVQRVLRLQHRWWQAHRREPTEAELAAALDCDPTTVRWLLSLQQDALSLDRPFEEEEEATLAEIVAAPDEGVLPDRLGDREVVAFLLDHLTGEERRVIELRYHLVEVPDVPDHLWPRLYTTVAKAMHISPERVKVKERRAFLKLRYWADHLRRKDQQEGAGHV